MKWFIPDTRSTIRTGIGGGNSIDRAGLVALIASFPGIEVVPVESNNPPDVLVWDAGSDISHLPYSSEETSILVLVSGADIGAFPPGIAGLFSKDEPPAALGIAIRQVARGQQYLSPSLAFSILRRQYQNHLAGDFDLNALTAREREILSLLAKGLSNKAIAGQLYLSVRTIEGHLDKLYTTLGVHSRTEAVIFAMQHSQNR